MIQKSEKRFEEFADIEGYRAVFAERLRSVMPDRDSIRRVGTLVNRSPAILNQYLDGKIFPGMPLFARLCVATGKSADYFLFGDDNALSRPVAASEED